MGTTFSQELFRKLPVVGILRFFKREEVEKLVPASLEGGLCNVEVTMNTAGAEDLIRLTVDLMGAKGNVGAGTVTTLETLDKALKAGATFIVTPGFSAPVVERCLEIGIPVIPGSAGPLTS